MRISRQDRYELILVNQPWLATLVLLALTLGLFGLCVAAFRDGETGLGVVFLFATAMFGIGLIGFAAFERVRLDRRDGIVEISGHNLLRSWSQTYRLADVDVVRLRTQRGSGKRARTTSVPVLVLRDPPGAEIPLSIVSGSHAPAQRAMRAISGWMDGSGETMRPKSHLAGMLPVLSLIGANLAAIAPVLTGYWDIRQLVTFYWVELVLIGILFLLKALIAASARAQRPARAKAPGLGVLAVMVVGGIAISAFALLQTLDLPQGEGMLAFIAGDHVLLVPIAAMAASHCAAFIASLFPSGRFEPGGVQRFGEHPFSRILVLAVTIGFAPFIAGMTGMPMLVAMVFVLIKVALDWRDRNIGNDRGGKALSHPDGHGQF